MVGFIVDNLAACIRKLHRGEHPVVLADPVLVEELAIDRHLLAGGNVDRSTEGGEIAIRGSARDDRMSICILPADQVAVRGVEFIEMQVREL